MSHAPGVFFVHQRQSSAALHRISALLPILTGLAQRTLLTIGQPVIGQPTIESMRPPESAMCSRPNIDSQWNDPAVPQISLDEETDVATRSAFDGGLQKCYERFESFGWAESALLSRC